MRQLITYSQRIVIKLGTGLLTTSEGRLDHDIINNLVGQIAGLIGQGRQVVLVSSGAIGAGFSLLHQTKRPKTLPLLQASASVGQAKLMRLYDDLFSSHDITVAQILLTRDDLKIRKRHLNIRNTLNTLLQHDVLPIINENDTVSVDEIRFGDNDLLSALVSNLIQADLLINLTSVDGLMEKAQDGTLHPTKIIHQLVGVPKSAMSHSTRATSKLGSGGMNAKLQAAKILTTAGEFMVIANGRKENILEKILSGEEIGTLFVPTKARMDSRKRWIAFFHQSKGKIIIDHGAQNALILNGKSLLPSGIKDVKGSFDMGDIVLIYNEDGEEIGKGLVNYSHTDVKKIAGHHTKEIDLLLGDRSYDEVIHRNNLVITLMVEDPAQPQEES
ncbi:MAG: glutamate 5-kinase [Candidatus Auribacterota bacterium]|jgi:glutamate 5-kinase|nr:glutamate 5-kinase [Candidatus Auribacterota bacterium]